MEPDPDEVLHPGSEDLVWSEEHEERVKNKNPAAQYTKFSEHARSMISVEKQCALFCGGKKCKYCTPNQWPEEKQVIKGLFSNWVTENILAMARPSDEIIDKYQILKQFKEAGIKSVINLQSGGEHADCGFGVKKSGFSYEPQRIMDSGMYYYNFAWPDYGVAGLSTILDMVKVMQFAVAEGKVAVHCHAGLGRTGVIIASYLVFTNRISAPTAIHYVRSQRHGSIQTRSQMQCIQEFEKYLKPFRVVFANKAKNSHEFTLQHFLNRQRHVLHGYEARKLKFVPKILYVSCERLLELANRGDSLSRQMSETDQNNIKKENIEGIQNLSMSDLPRIESQSSLDETVNNQLTKTYGSSNMTRNESQPSLCDLEKNDKRPKLVKRKSFSMEDLTDGNLTKLMTNDGSGSETDSMLTVPWDTDDKNEEKVQNGINEKPFVAKQQMEVRTAMDIAEAIGAPYHEDNVYAEADVYEKKLNECDDTWLEISRETNPEVLSVILWEWLDQLKEPILRVQDLNVMLQFVSEPDIGLQKLEKGARNTIVYLLKVFSKLKPIDTDLEVKLFEKLLSYLTQQWVTQDDLSMSTTESWAMSTRDSSYSRCDREHWGTMKPSMSRRLFGFFAKLKEMVDNDDGTSLSSSTKLF